MKGVATSALGAMCDLGLGIAGRDPPVSRSIISFLLGLDSTWQWAQAWLQYRPTLSCRMVVVLRTMGALAWFSSNCLIATKSWKEGAPRESRARRRFLRCVGMGWNEGLGGWSVIQTAGERLTSSIVIFFLPVLLSSFSVR